MTSTSNASVPAGRAAWPSFRAGVRATAGLSVGGTVFGILFGILAVGRDFSEAHALLMSATVFAGAAQIAVLEIWTDPLPYLPIAVTAALVNTRHVLMGITLHDVLSRPGRRPPFGSLFLLTDANWALTLSERTVPNRLAYFAGSGLVMYVGWMIGTAIGVVAPGLLDATTIEGLRIGGALFIAILLCIFFRGSRWPRLLPPVLSGVVAVVASGYVDSASALMIGVAAAAAATLLREFGRNG